MISAIVKSSSPKKPSPLRRVLDARDFQIMIPLNFAVDPIFKLDEEGDEVERDEDEVEGDDEDDNYQYGDEYEDEDKSEKGMRESRNKEHHVDRGGGIVLTRQTAYNAGQAQGCTTSKGEEGVCRDTGSGLNHNNISKDNGNEGGNNNTGDGHADEFTCSYHGRKEGSSGGGIDGRRGRPSEMLWEGGESEARPVGTAR